MYQLCTKSYHEFRQQGYFITINFQLTRFTNIVVEMELAFFLDVQKGKKER